MKKVMIGVLILIPVIILLVIAAVSNIVSITAAIGVEEVNVYLRGTTEVAELKVLEFEDVSKEIQNVYNMVDIQVLPAKANNYSIDFSISNLTCTDDEYDGDDAAYMVDIWKNNKKVASNTTGDFAIKSYCYFTINIKVETIVKSFNVQVVGYDVERIKLKNEDKDNATLYVGESILLTPSYHPIDSIIKDTEWISSDNDVVSVDKNGVITAKKAGTAEITMKTKKYSNNEQVTSSKFAVTVQNGISTKFGPNVNVSSSSFTLNSLGIDSYDTISGATELDGNITFDSGSDTAVISKGPKTITIKKVDSNAIGILNSNIYSLDAGYVFEVSDLKLKLDAIYLDDLKADKSISAATWTSSNKDVATVENGVVTPLSSGLVTITAKYNNKEASVQLNVQKKVTFVTLSSLNECNPTGLAEETVFASMKYDGENKIANTTLIRIDGEPKSATEEELEIFYSAYNFKVVSGTDYAEFSNDIVNKLIFKSGLEGKGKQTIVVEVSAKYPKYISVPKFTTVNVDVKAVYGISVNNMAEMRKAVEEQKNYAFATGNVHDQVETDRFTTPKGETFIFANAPYSDKTLAIALTGNCHYELNEDGSSKVTVEYETNLAIYGDLYGNNHFIQASTGQATSDDAMVVASWSNITISNVKLQPSTIEGDTISKEDTHGLDGSCMEVYYKEDYYDFNRISGIKIEYCLFENGYRAIDVFNADISIKGCVFRNFCSCASYVPTRIHYNTYKGVDAYNLIYSNIECGNCVISNSLGSFITSNYEYVTILENSILGGHVYRFANTEEENYQFFNEKCIKKGYNGSFTQTGFIDMYNWSNVNAANLIETGVDTYNDLIGQVGGEIVSINPLFENARVMGDDGFYYLMLGFMQFGINGTIFDEPNYFNYQLDTNVFVKKRMADLNEGGDDDFYVQVLKGVGLDLSMYVYRSDSEITYNSTFTINNEFYEKLHGRQN